MSLNYRVCVPQRKILHDTNESQHSHKERNNFLKKEMHTPGPYTWIHRIRDAGVGGPGICVLTRARWFCASCQRHTALRVEDTYLLSILISSIFRTSSEEWGHSCLPSWKLRNPRLADLLRKLPFSFNIYDFSPAKYSSAFARVELAGVDLFFKPGAQSNWCTARGNRIWGHHGILQR